MCCEVMGWVTAFASIVTSVTAIAGVIFAYETVKKSHEANTIQILLKQQSRYEKVWDCIHKYFNEIKEAREPYEPNIPDTLKNFLLTIDKNPVDELMRKEVKDTINILQKK